LFHQEEDPFSRHYWAIIALYRRRIEQIHFGILKQWRRRTTKK
jgi:hypothetical protein